MYESLYVATSFRCLHHKHKAKKNIKRMKTIDGTKKKGGNSLQMQQNFLTLPIAKCLTFFSLHFFLLLFKRVRSHLFSYHAGNAVNAEDFFFVSYITY